VGLVQREIEAAGISTVTLSSVWAFTASVGAPRVAAIEHPQGRPVGRPGDVSGQQAVVRAALRVLQDATGPGTVVHLPFDWPEAPREARSRPQSPPPIATLLRRKPWLLPKLFKGEIPE
jgi:D-proline reductase (dithiol) PrdB